MWCFCLLCVHVCSRGCMPTSLHSSSLYTRPFLRLGHLRVYLRIPPVRSMRSALPPVLLCVALGLSALSAPQISFLFSSPESFCVWISVREESVLLHTRALLRARLPHACPRREDSCPCLSVSLSFAPCTRRKVACLRSFFGYPSFPSILSFAGPVFVSLRCLSDRERKTGGSHSSARGEAHAAGEDQTEK